MINFKIRLTLLWCFLLQYINSSEPILYNDAADIAFLIDSSGSLTPFNYQNEKSFVKEVMKELMKSSSQLNAAVLAFSDDVFAGLDFSHKFNLTYFNDIVDDLPHLQQFTRMDKALIYTSDYIFTTFAGSRPYASKIAVLITDGANSKLPGVVPLRIASEPLKQKGVRILVIAERGGADIHELLDITEREDDVILVNGLPFLSEFVGVLVNKVESAIDNPIVQLSENGGTLFAGRKAVFHCIASGLPPPTAKWLMNGKELRNGDLNKTITLERKTDGEQLQLSLHISDVDFGHAGIVTCEAENKYCMKRRSIQVSVSCPPALFTLAALRPRVGLTTANATLECVVKGLAYQQIYLYQWQWKFQEKEIVENGKYQMFTSYSPPNLCQHSKASATLQINNVSQKDFGEYKCTLYQFTNVILAEEDISFSDFVHSKVPSRPIILNSIVLKCGRALNVTWSPPSSDVSITGYEISLKYTSEEQVRQAVNLSCEVISYEFVGLKSNTFYEVHLRARNSEGSSHWTSIHLKTTAEKPNTFNAQAVPFGCSAKVSWDTPSANSCPITRYTIHYRESMTSTSNEGAWQPSLNVSRVNKHRLWLKCNTRYDVVVMAWNRRGHSDFNGASMLSVLTETGVPFKPLLKDIIEKQCGMFEVIWKPPLFDSGGGPVTGFQVQIKAKDENWRNCTMFPTNQSCLFKELMSETKYDIRVQALNEKGSSDWKKGSTKTGFIGPPDIPAILNNKSELTGRNVTVVWTPPSNANCNVTMYSIRYRVIDPSVENWVEINITDSKIKSYELHLQYSKRYAVVIFAWNHLGQSAKGRTWEVRTAQDVPYQPVLHKPILGECNSVNITWSPPTRQALGYPVTDYRVQIKRVGPGKRWINCTLFNISNSPSCLFTHLEKYTKYDVRVMAKNKIGYGLPSEMRRVLTEGAGINITDSKIKSYELHLQYSKKYAVVIFAWNNLGHSVEGKAWEVRTAQDLPGKPEVVVEVSGCNVTVKWTTPPWKSCPILFYTIEFTGEQTLQDNKKWATINVTDPTVKKQELMLNCTTTYVFRVKAWNDLGGGSLSTKQSATTGGRSTQADDGGEGDASSFLDSNTLLIIALIVACAAVLLLLQFIGLRFYRKRSTNQPKRTSNDIQVLEHCEIHPIRTEFVSDLGEGAFGRVHKAKLKDGLDFFTNTDDSVNGNGQQKIVAVKELHENATEEQKKEFLDEIELMTKVGKHQNVLSFLGCWTTTKPLLLIIEYVAHGDLLHWLRRKRSQINKPTSSIDYCNAGSSHQHLYADKRTQNTTADQNEVTNGRSKEDLEHRAGSCFTHNGTEQTGCVGNNECLVPLVVFAASKNEESAQPVNRDSECSENCESFYQGDLMSFAWQIARGMSYLAEKGLVHRDLAARNVLIGHSKLLKIADFGLMRQIYHEVYEVNKQKKLPLKWMAPESIYEQIFTSKSDVWSYGVVMWEIATVGGSPYPLLNNTELVTLLKTGYRMEKPDFCSEIFYSMMRECWKEDPAERPSFQELFGRLEQMMLQEVDYFDFNNVDESKDYYQMQKIEKMRKPCHEQALDHDLAA